jgi:hypothetical protein
MAKINTPISLSAQELIRDKIVQILALELPNQATLLNDQDVNAEVERERNTAIQFTELPLINIALARTDGQKQNQTANTGSYYYDIDIYTKGLNDEDGDDVDGDELAAIKNQKIHRVVTGILSATVYRKLDLPAGIVNSLNVISYQPQRSLKIGDSENTDQARIQVKVDATDSNITEVALALIKSSTESTLGASGKKYVWVWDKVI